MVRSPRRLIWFSFSATLGLALLLTTQVLAFPPNTIPFLTYKGVGSDAEAAEYYAVIGAPATFSAWKAAYGFTGADEVRAVYYNAGDLGFGRDMHCRRSGADVACYVANHGFGPGGPPAESASAAVTGAQALPAVAMVYRDSLDGLANDVSFYIYNQVTGTLLNKVGLDGEGDKFVPYLCLPCHGGNYNPTTSSVTGAEFLPFDAPSFKYSALAGFSLAEQQEAFRQLNHMVRDTNPAALIVELIDGWYGNAVHVPGATLNDGFVASGYAGDPGLYNNVVKPYCRTCHIAQAGFPLSDPTYVDVAQPAVFNGFYMPHAQLTNHNFWNSPAPVYLANNRGWALRVTTTADTYDGVCDANCSLRDAIAVANANVDRSIITFNVNGTFSLSRSGADDNAVNGDLDITQPLTLLGNGAGRTSLNGNGVDRVFHILGSASVVIQDVTIRGGSTGGNGGGILVDGGALFLNNSVLRNNAAGQGGGLANIGGIVEINRSAIGPGNNTVNAGAGLYNEHHLTVNDTAISGNSSGTAGGGFYNFGSGDVLTVTHSTITGNSATNTGGGFRNFLGAVGVRNSIIAGNTGGGSVDCGNHTQAISLGFNLVGQNDSANGCPVGGNDVVLAGPVSTALNPNLGAQPNGVLYHGLVPGGPATDRAPVGANCALPTYDQRNVSRPLDSGGDATVACDIGAREEVPHQPVTTAADVTANDGLCSLREAVTAVNTGLASGSAAGECAGGRDIVDLVAAGPYTLTNGQLTLSGWVTINGQGKTIQQTTPGARVIQVLSGGGLNLNNAEVRGGSQTGGGDAASGGGLYIVAGGTANIVNSAIVGNSTESWGGGIANLGVLNIANSTVSGNTAAVDSGGINTRGTTRLVNVTVSNNLADADANDAGDGGGLGVFGGTITVRGSLIAANFDTPDNLGPVAIPGGEVLSQFDVARAEAEAQGEALEAVGPLAGVNPDVYLSFGTITSANYNLIGNGTNAGGSFAQPNDLVNVNPQLGALTGSPGFHPLGPTSQARDRILAADCAFISEVGNPLYTDGTALPSDQRGFRRPIDVDLNGVAQCDIGAVEAALAVFLPLIRR